MQYCSVEDCHRPYSAKGFCHLHYNRWMRHGDPLKARRMMPRGSSAKYRLEALTIRGGPNDCWPWDGTIHRTGYGTLQVHGVSKGAHVWAYLVHKGKIPEGKFVLHSCDNRECVNPRHLRLGTHQDNMDDKVERNRVSRLQGMDAPSRKITETQAIEIIQRYATESISTKALSIDYGISPAQIQNIVSGRQWAHLDREKIIAELGVNA